MQDLRSANFVTVSYLSSPAILRGTCEPTCPRRALLRKLIPVLATITTAAAASGLTVGGYFYAAMWPTSQIFGRTLLAGRHPNEYALTFDDGPNDPTPRNSSTSSPAKGPRHLLPHRSFVRERPELTRQILAAGHLIGNHTTTHPVLPLSRRARCATTRVMNAMIEDAIGQKRPLLPPAPWRAPSRRPPLRTRPRPHPVLWNAMGYDWKPRQSPEQILPTLPAASSATAAAAAAPISSSTTVARSRSARTERRASKRPRPCSPARSRKKSAS